jgi:hypothetical protein
MKLPVWARNKGGKNGFNVHFHSLCKYHMSKANVRYSGAKKGSVLANRFGETGQEKKQQ